MLTSIEYLRDELRSLFAVPLDHSHWATSELLNFTIVRNVAEVFGFSPTEMPFALATTILLTINDQLVPAGPEAPLDAWKLLVACEFNFLSRFRRSSALALSDQMAPTTRVRWEKLNEEFVYTPADFLNLSDEQRAVVIRKSLVNLWGWKAQTNPFDQPDALLWRQLHIQLSQAAVFSKDVIYENRTKLRDKVAQSLYHTQRPGLGNGTRIADYLKWASALFDKPVERLNMVSESPPNNLPLPSLPSSPEAIPEVDPAIPEDFVSLRNWVNARFRETSSPIELIGLPDKARRLAQHLAAIVLEIEPGAVRTSRLVFMNVNKALRQIWIEPEQTNEGDVLMDFLVRAGFLNTVDDHKEFVEPRFAQFFAAEYITQYDVNWVSAHPGCHQLMCWAATILAQRQDDLRNEQFFDELRKLARITGDVYATLDYADYLVEFKGLETPAVIKFRECVANVLRDSVRIDSNRLRWVLWAKAQQLGEDVSSADFSTLPESFISPDTLAVIRASTDLKALLSGLRISPKGNQDEWLQAGQVVQALLAAFRKSHDFDLKRQYAAWLQGAELSVAVSINFNAWWYTPRLTALEAIAQIALDQKLDSFTRALARGILAREEFIIQLSRLESDYSALVYTLELALGKRRWFNRKEDKWEMVPYAY